MKRMTRISVFALPRNPYTFLGKALGLITDDWTWVDGTLKATDAMLKTRKVAPGVGYCLNHAAKLVTESPSTDPTYDALHEMILSPRIPQFVRFEKAGLDGPPFALAKRVVTDYLAQGFIGTVCFRGEDVYIALSHGDDRPSHIQLRTEGRNDRLAPFFRLCRSHRLKPLDPSVSPF